VSTVNNRKSLHDATASSGLGCGYLRDFFCTAMFLQLLTANSPKMSLMHGNKESGMHQLPAASAFPLGFQYQHLLVPAFLPSMYVTLILSSCGIQIWYWHLEWLI